MEYYLIGDELVMKKEQNREDDYRILSDVEHVLLRPNTYLGSVDINEIEEYLFNRKETKFEMKKVSYIPGLRKMIDEVLDNSIDEYTKSGKKFSNKIKITIDQTSITIEDNGRGIPVKILKGSEKYIPEAMFTELKAGSNFSDDDRNSIGVNGIGASLTCIWSKLFEVTTSDGENQLKLKVKDNNSSHTVKVTSSIKKGTTVTFTPDFVRFKIKGFSSIYSDVIYSRLVFLSFIHPGISFTFNGEKIPSCKDKQFLSYFMSNFETISNDKVTIAVGSAEEFKFLSYVNALYLSKGGIHLDYISSYVVNFLKVKLEKKYKTIKPSDIKNKLFVFAFFNDFINMRFDSQTKEFLSNSIPEVKDYLTGIDLDKLGSQLLKNKDILFSIEENFKIKEEFALRKELSSAEKVNKKKIIPKYLPSINKNKYIVLTEGDSASNSLSDILGRQDYGYFPLRGKPLSVYEAKMKDLVANEELINVCSIMGISMSKDDNTTMEFDYVLIASDQDTDGLHIRGLLIAFFFRFAKTLLREGKIRFLNTPIMNTKGKDGKPDKWVYSMKDGKDLKPPVYYSKGLGSWKKTDLQFIIAKDGLDTMIQTFELDDDTESSLNLWFGKDSQLRKDVLKELVFSYDSI